MIKPLRLFKYLLLISGISFTSVTSAFADGENDTEKNEIDITLSPTDTLFDISNMKPGDWAPRTLIVGNTGSQDFEYQIQLQNSGEKKLFNELLLEIKAGTEGLYEGKLAEFKSLTTRELISGSSETLDITIRFPEHLENDFQGLDAEFILNFIAEGQDNTAVETMITGHVDSSSSTPGGFSPATSWINIYNLIIAGSVIVASGFVLIIFRHYRRMKLVQ